MFLCKSSKWRLLAQYFSACLIDDRVDRHCAYGSNVLLWVTWDEPLFLTNHEPPVIWHEVDTACRECHRRGEGLTSQEVLLHFAGCWQRSAWPLPAPLLPSECSFHWLRGNGQAPCPPLNAHKTPHPHPTAQPGQNPKPGSSSWSSSDNLSMCVWSHHLNSHITVWVGVHSAFVEELNHYK